MNRLTEIANFHRTDKGTVHYEAHGYTEEYDKYIPEIGNYTLLEIGVWHGDSLRMWKDYNPDLNIHGVDNDPAVINYIQSEENLTVHIGDGTSQQFLDDVFKKSGEFDFIIDDGSHIDKDIISTFNCLYPNLKKGGYYFIEDLHAGYASREETICKINSMLETEGVLVCKNKLFIIKK